jgi:hypothetical protein
MMIPHRLPGALPLLLALAIAGCRLEPNVRPSQVSQEVNGPAEEQEAFWNALAAHCGNAYAGHVSDVTPYYRDGLEGRRMVAHFRECTGDRIHVAFHLDEDRSRNWIVTKELGTLRLKHDHRYENGAEAAVTQYGGDADRPGLPTRQIFRADTHTATILPDRADNFWFMDLIDANTLQYGVHWPRLGHSVRLEFDLSAPVETPPAPWGY